MSHEFDEYGEFRKNDTDIDVAFADVAKNLYNGRPFPVSRRGSARTTEQNCDFLKRKWRWDTVFEGINIVIQPDWYQYGLFKRIEECELITHYNHEVPEEVLIRYLRRYILSEFKQKVGSIRRSDYEIESELDFYEEAEKMSVSDHESSDMSSLCVSRDYEKNKKHKIDSTEPNKKNIHDDNRENKGLFLSEEVILISKEIEGIMASKCVEEFDVWVKSKSSDSKIDDRINYFKGIQKTNNNSILHSKGFKAMRKLDTAEEWLKCMDSYQQPAKFGKYSYFYSDVVRHLKSIGVACSYPSFEEKALIMKLLKGGRALRNNILLMLPEMCGTLINIIICCLSKKPLPVINLLIEEIDSWLVLGFKEFEYKFVDCGMSFYKIRNFIGAEFGERLNKWILSDWMNDELTNDKGRVVITNKRFKESSLSLLEERSCKCFC